MSHVWVELEVQNGLSARDGELDRNTGPLLRLCTATVLGDALYDTIALPWPAY
jgi:hypothetical protein